MPNAIFQLEQRLEPFVEWLDGLAASAVDRFAAAAAIELPTSQASPVRFVTRLDGLPTRFGLRATLVLRTQEASARSFAVVRVFNALAHVVTVVSTVSRDVLGRFGKVVDL